MPYIDPIHREALDYEIVALMEKLDEQGSDPGDLNYAITQLCLGFLTTPEGLRYKSIALVTGVLENVKQELYRRLAAVYEDKKMKQNGDVGYDET